MYNMYMSKAEPAIISGSIDLRPYHCHKDLRFLADRTFNARIIHLMFLGLTECWLYVHCFGSLQIMCPGLGSNLRKISPCNPPPFRDPFLLIVFFTFQDFSFYIIQNCKTLNNNNIFEINVQTRRHPPRYKRQLSLWIHTPPIRFTCLQVNTREHVQYTRPRQSYIKCSHVHSTKFMTLYTITNSRIGTIYEYLTWVDKIPLKVILKGLHF